MPPMDTVQHRLSGSQSMGGHAWLRGARGQRQSQVWACWLAGPWVRAVHVVPELQQGRGSMPGATQALPGQRPPKPARLFERWYIILR